MNDSILFLVIGLLAGAAIGYLAAKALGKGKQPSTGLDAQALEQKLQVTEQEKNTLLAEKMKLEGSREKSLEVFNEQNTKLNRSETENKELTSKLATAEARVKEFEVRLKETKIEVEELQQKFAKEFENIANRILDEKSKKFTEQNKTQIGDVLNPLKEKIASFEKKVEESNKENVERTSALKEQISNLRDLNLQITREAENLTKALKGDSKSQGTWGEIQLEAVLEKAGLEKEIHYFKEKNVKSDEGDNQRPDYIVKLPDDKFLIIDSKVSLVAYTNYFNTTDEVQQGTYLKNHLKSIEKHIDDLGGRNYQNVYGLNQPDYTLLFVANEPALTIAFKEDNSLFDKALKKNVVLVSNSTLLATLRTIGYIWKQDRQTRNALAIAQQAGSLYDKFVLFLDELEKIGRSIDTARNTYEDARKKLTDGKDNLVRKVERLKELGAKTTKDIPDKLLE